MGSADEDKGEPPGVAAVSWLEAALQAGLGAGPRPDLARQALQASAPPDTHLEAWLEAVATELSAGAVLVPEDMVEAVAARMIADRGCSLRAHARVQGGAVRHLLPDP